MYQQGSLDLLHANKMAETLMRLQQEQQQQGQNYVLPSGVMDRRGPLDEGARRQSYDQPAAISQSSSTAINYSHAQQQQMPGGIPSAAINGNAAGAQELDGVSSSLFVVMPRTEYDFMKQELVMLKQSLSELKATVGYEIQQLKAESRSLKQHVDSCSCGGAWRVAGDAKETSRKSSTWTSDAWGNRTYTGNQHGSCSPSTSSPEHAEQSGVGFSGGGGYFGGSLPPGLSRDILGSPQSLASRSLDRGKLIQLLPNYDVWVNKMNLQIVVNEAPTRKDGAALFVLRRVIPLVFAWEELACSRGQGLNCKTTDDVFGKVPLDPTKVAACKAFMRKFCVDNGCMEPTERSINQTFSHQVNYARRRLKTAANPSCVSPSKKSKKLRRDLQQLLMSPKDEQQQQQVKTEHYLQM